nr:16S rRNA (cytidine(1402)-2'-O)-methyltransferase [Natronospirillum sp.]
MYVVATPIGHLGDISHRALAVLQGASRILAEDTRHSQKLLQHYGIDRPLVSLHEHNERQRIDRITEWLAAGETLALISDAGTPLISDPGYPLVAALVESGHRVVPVPGANAAVAALSVAGLPTDRFQFCGFAPVKAGARRTFLERLLAYTGTSVIYEAPRRIIDTLALLAELAPQRPLVLARELTKQFETVLRGSAQSVLQQVQADSDQCRGEMVLLIGGAEPQDQPSDRVDPDDLLLTLAGLLPPKQAAGEAARLLGVSKNLLYQRLLALRDDTR